jgi:hypothetical protein
MVMPLSPLRTTVSIMDWRTMRLAELWAMKSASPTRVIALFRHHAVLTETSPIPNGYNLEKMIEVIVDYEARDRTNDGSQCDSASARKNPAGKTGPATTQ